MQKIKNNTKPVDLEHNHTRSQQVGAKAAIHWFKL